MLILAVIPFLSLSFANPILFDISSTSLVSRAAPADQRCEHANEWNGRYCEERVGIGAWCDRCTTENGAVYHPGGQCPEGEHCFERRDQDGDYVIDCTSIPATPDRDDVVTTKLQLGKRGFNADNGPNLERIVTVELKQDIPSASVSAHVMDTKLSYVFDPTSIIKANKRGYQDTRCQEGLSPDDGLLTLDVGRTCSPNGVESLKKGDKLDFTFGMGPKSEGYLVYQIKGY